MHFLRAKIARTHYATAVAFSVYIQSTGLNILLSQTAYKVCYVHCMVQDDDFIIGGRKTKPARKAHLARPIIAADLSTYCQIRLAFWREHELYEASGEGHGDCQALLWETVLRQAK